MYKWSGYGFLSHLVLLSNSNSLQPQIQASIPLSTILKREKERKYKKKREEITQIITHNPLSVHTHTTNDPSRQKTFQKRLQQNEYLDSDIFYNDFETAEYIFGRDYLLLQLLSRLKAESSLFNVDCQQLPICFTIFYSEFIAAILVSLLLEMKKFW